MSWMLVAVLVFVVSCVLTIWVRRYAVSRDLLDHPNQRSSHATVTPRGGGLAVVISFFFAVLYLFNANRLPEELFYTLTIGGGLIAAVGYWDDHDHVSPWKRILVHFFAAGVYLYWFGGISVLNFGIFEVELGWAGYILAAVFMVWLLNLYNFMDGIDAIAGVEAICVSVGAGALIIFQGAGIAGYLSSILMVGLMLMMAVAGFLVWNWPPAKIFLGDVGSGFIGYVIAIFALASVYHEMISLWTWVVLLGIFIVDASITLMRRFFNGQRWYEAHRSHAYQHAAIKYGSHRKVVLGVIAINVLWLYPMAYLTCLYDVFGFLLAVVAMLPLAVLSLWFDAGIEDNARLVRVSG